MLKRIVFILIGIMLAWYGCALTHICGLHKLNLEDRAHLLHLFITLILIFTFLFSAIISFVASFKLSARKVASISYIINFLLLIIYKAYLINYLRSK